jgi:hypothetical protein
VALLTITLTLLYSRRRKTIARSARGHEYQGTAELEGASSKRAELEGDHKHAQEISSTSVGVKATENNEFNLPLDHKELDAGDLLSDKPELEGDRNRAQEISSTSVIFKEVQGNESHISPDEARLGTQAFVPNKSELEGDQEYPKELISPIPLNSEDQEPQKKEEDKLSPTIEDNSSKNAVPEPMTHETSSTMTASPLSGNHVPDVDEEMRWLEREEQRIATRKQELEVLR